MGIHHLDEAKGLERPFMKLRRVAEPTATMADTLCRFLPRKWKLPLRTERAAGGQVIVEPILLTQTRRIGRDVRGVTAIEYGLLVGGIALSIIAVVFLIGDDLAAVFESIDERIQSVRACERAHVDCGKG